ncbi:MULTISPECIES: hypothetical protein [Streptosporangium]|uniref:Outer membrane biosynthesis protein TonB n=1 Tax=Streptosporangium brasiliense TaxID=47480 RepID=A0ABT9QWK5_9ACTN|nr:hypothetical protein [Streptosporangium brasiliense]MDP9861360.1 outer membrane biosynthesis protein TonB [Streptosporangium brasiliense]
MTESPDEYGELLRRVLSAEADSVVPSPDGLEIIRARVERRGLRGLMWWRAGASIAGAVLVAATVVMVVPEFREQVTRQVNDVNFTHSTPPDLSATSRAPSNGDDPLPVVTKPEPGTTAPLPTPTHSRSSAPHPKPSPKPTHKPTPTPEPTPSPTCPTTPPDGTVVEPEELTEECRTPAPTPRPSESSAPSGSPCSVEECPPTDDQSAPMPTETTSISSGG